MKTFKELINEVAEPKAGDEKRFKDKHVVAKVDHPAAEEDQFTAKKIKKKKNDASYDEGEDKDVYEEVDLDEAKNYEIKNGKIHISKANFRKVHKDYKNATKGKERMMALDPKTGATTSFAVVFTEEVNLEEAAATTKQKAALKSLMTKALGGKRAKPGYTSAIATNGDFVVHDGGGRVVGRINKGDYTDPLSEEKMSDAEMKKREEIVKAMKDSKDDFKKRYGDKWKSVMYATATKSAMKESVETISEDVLADLRDIVKRKSMKEVKFADGSKTKVDMTTANAMVRVHDALNPQNQKKFADAINKDQKMFMKMMDFAFSAGKK